MRRKKEGKTPILRERATCVSKRVDSIFGAIASSTLLKRGRNCEGSTGQLCILLETIKLRDSPRAIVSFFSFFEPIQILMPTACACNADTFVLVMTGADLRTVAELLRDRTLAMVMRYAHLAPD